MAGEVFFSKMAPVFSIHQEDTRDVFNTFNELHQSELFSDFTIKCQSKMFPVHRAVLVSQSTYFHSLLVGDDVNTRSTASHITLDTIDPDTLKLILNFIYSGCLTNVLEANAKSLREAAEKLGIKEIVNKCKRQELVSTTPTPENCMDGWKTGIEVKDDDLCDKFSKVALNNFSEVTTCPSFVNLDLNMAKVYLGHKDLETGGSDLILSAALNWVRADLKKRLPHLPVLLRSVPLHTIDVNVLKYLLAGEPMFRQQSESRTILQEAINRSGDSQSDKVGESSPPNLPKSCVAVTWCHSKTIKLYDSSLREELRSVTPPAQISDIQYTGCCMQGNVLFVCGEKSLHSYHLKSKKWQMRGELNYYRVCPALVADDDDVYIFGGRRGVLDYTAENIVEIWNKDHRSVTKRGKVLGSECPSVSCCFVDPANIAVWGLWETGGYMVQIYSINNGTVTGSVRVPEASMGKGVLSAGYHLIMYDANDIFLFRSSSAKKLKNSKPSKEDFDALILSEDKMSITALCRGHRVFTSTVKDILSDEQSSWSVVDVNWAKNYDERWVPGSVCAAYGLT